MIFDIIEIVGPNKFNVISIIIDTMINKSIARTVLNLYFVLYFLFFLKLIISYINNTTISIVKNNDNEYCKIFIKLYFGKIYIVVGPSAPPIISTDVFSEILMLLYFNKK